MAEIQKAYCDEMVAVAQPLEARAVDAFTMCLVKSTEVGWFADSSRHCERQLARLKPDEFPLAHELRAQPLYVAPIIAIEQPPR